MLSLPWQGTGIYFKLFLKKSVLYTSIFLCTVGCQKYISTPFYFYEIYSASTLKGFFLINKSQELYISLQIDLVT